MFWNVFWVLKILSLIDDNSYIFESSWFSIIVFFTLDAKLVKEAALMSWFC